MLASVLLAGCTPPSMNEQRSALRAAGDVFTTIYLDDRAAADIPKRKSELKQLSEKLLEFLSDGNAAALTETKLKDGVLKLVPKGYRDMADNLLSSLSKRKAEVKIDKIGQDNIDRLKAFLIGALLGIDKYNMDHRKKEPEQPAPTPPAPPSGLPTPEDAGVASPVTP
jgi:hypothetical protein